MNEPATELKTVHTVIAELAGIVAGARAALGGGRGRSDAQLEMAEMDLLSARSAVEKACWELEITLPADEDRGESARPIFLGRMSGTGRDRRRRPGERTARQGQCELFSLPAP